MFLRHSLSQGTHLQGIKKYPPRNIHLATVYLVYDSLNEGGRRIQIWTPTKGVFGRFGLTLVLVYARYGSVRRSPTSYLLSYSGNRKVSYFRKVTR